MGLGVNLNGIYNQIGRPLPTFFEDWQSLDAAIWTATNPATGSAWTAPTVVNGAHGNIYCMAAPNAVEQAKIISNKVFVMNTADITYIRRKLILEFEAKFSNPLNIDSASIFGIADGGGAGVVFKIISGVLYACSPYGHVAISPSFLNAGVLTNQNKYRIEVSKGPHTFAINNYFVNDKLVATFDENSVISPAFIWQGQADFDFTTLAGACSIYVGEVRAWYKDVP